LTSANGQGKIAPPLDQQVTPLPQRLDQIAAALMRLVAHFCSRAGCDLFTQPISN
jgi:hypothetical protein